MLSNGNMWRRSLLVALTALLFQLGGCTARKGDNVDEMEQRQKEQLIRMG